MAKTRDMMIEGHDTCNDPCHDDRGCAKTRIGVTEAVPRHVKIMFESLKSQRGKIIKRI